MNLRNDRRIKFYLFLFFLAFYLLFTGDHFSEPYYASDEKLMILTTQQIVDNFSLHFPETYGVTTSRYGILQSIVAIPFYCLAKVVALFFPENQTEIIATFIIYFTNAFITAFLIVCFYSFSRYLKYPPKTAFYSSIVLGLCTTIFPYAKYFFSEPLVALTLLNSIYNFIKATKVPANLENRKRQFYLFKSSLWFALCLLTRIDNLSLIIIFILAIILLSYRNNQYVKSEKSISVNNLLLDFLVFFIPVLISGIIILILNYLRFGSLLKSGYNEEPFTTSLFVGLYGLLFSPSRGIFIYSPPIIITLFFIKRFWRRRSFLIILIIGITIIKLYFFAIWWSWYGGWSWGSRFLLPIIPLYFLFFNEAFLRFKKFSSVTRLLIISLIIIGFVVQLIGVLINPSKYDNNIFGLINRDENQFLFLPQLSSLIGNIDIIKMGFIDSFILKFTEHFNSSILLIILIILIGSIFFSFIRLKKFVGFGWKDVVQFKPIRLFTKLEKLIAVLIIINVIIYLVSFVTVYSNKITRYVQIKYNDGEESLEKKSDKLLCIEKSINSKRASIMGEKEIKEINMKWIGTLWIPKEGEYWFYTKASGYYLLRIGDKNILGNKDADYQHTSTASEYFKRGYYDFVLDYKPVDINYQLIHLYWTIPGNGIYKSILSNQFLFVQKPNVFRQILLALNTFKFFFVLISIILVYVVRIIMKVS